MSEHFTLICTDCGKHLEEGTFAYLCPDCSEKQLPDRPPAGVLKTVYNYSDILKKFNHRHVFDKLKENLFTDILPVCNRVSFGPLKAGNTPLYQFEIANGQKEKISFYLKDDSQNPTFSFKDRASQVISAYAKEHGITTIVAATTGNAGSSLAGICASQSQKSIIIVPESAPAAKLIQVIMYGATLIPVKGNYDAAFNLSLEATRHFGWFNRNTAYNPFTIEGKKTVSFEIFEQTCGNLPSHIFVPVGDGVIISGVYKGFEDLMKLGLISEIPVIVAVQSENSDNLVRNIDNDHFEMRPSSTLADSISVDFPRNFNMAKHYLKKYSGQWITVSDDDILNAASMLACETGIFAEPASAAAMAGMMKLIIEKPHISQHSMLVLSTGSGLKDIHTPLKHIHLPKAIAPDMSALKDFLHKNEHQ